MATVFKVSLPGVDVKRARPEECAVHSDYPAPKIDSALKHFINVQIDFKSEPPNPGVAGATTTTILYKDLHDYTYTPELWVHVEYTLNFGTVSQTFGPGDAFLGAVGAFDATYLRVYADTKNYYIAIEKTSSFLDNTQVLAVVGTSLNVRIYILADGVLDS
jgi:hypothetical protein